jgi:hypothetical protein
VQAVVLDSNPTTALVCGRTGQWYTWTGKAEDPDRDYLQNLDVPLNSGLKPPTLLPMPLQDERAAAHQTFLKWLEAYMSDEEI